MNQEINKLITALRSKDGILRKKSRKNLVKIGKPAVPFLIRLLSDPNEHVRWEACKALVSIKDPGAATILVSTLSDESTEIRWLAAEALIAIKSQAVIPLLQALEKKFDSPFLRQGAHHILHALAKQKLLTIETIAVLDELRPLKPIDSVGWAASVALNSIKKTHANN